ncbi:MAG: hypothetical protein JW943_11520 [Deltaproteobacteria bacterium]|nr:hypothetical protein [Deltaproteobacteria bacterium]
MKEDELYFRIFLRGPEYPVIVISGDDIYPAFKIKELGNICYSLSPPGSSNKIAVVDSTGKEFFYMTDQTTLAPGIGGKNWTKKRIIDLFNKCNIAQEAEIHYSPKSLSNKRVATIINEICTMLATTIKST